MKRNSKKETPQSNNKKPNKNVILPQFLQTDLNELQVRKTNASFHVPHITISESNTEKQFDQIELLVRKI